MWAAGAMLRDATHGLPRSAINILDGDQLIEAKLTDGNCEIMLAVKSGRAIRFPEEKVRSTGRGGIGVYGIEVDDVGY